MRRTRVFLGDETARIPFAVLGVFLLIGSSILTVSVTRLEQQKALEMSSVVLSDQVTRLLHRAEADSATILNIAGLSAFKQIGANPVQIPNPSAGYGVTAEQVNIRRAQERIIRDVNAFFDSCFLSTPYTDGQYSITVRPIDSTSQLFQPESLQITPVTMRLQRPIRIPLIGSLIGPEHEVVHQTYYMLELPVEFEIQSQDSRGERTVVTIHRSLITTLLTSRFPLLESLTNEYEDCIDGTFSKLWTFTTILSNAYSLIRGFKHYKSGKPANVVDNRHLAVITNSGLALEQALVFGSVNPLSLVELARQTMHTLKQQPQDPLDIFNEHLNEESGYGFESSLFFSASANVDAGDPPDTAIQDCPALNISDIALGILYNITGVHLYFEHEDGRIEQDVIVFDETQEPTHIIQQTIWERANNSWVLVLIQKLVNPRPFISELISDIASEIYQAELYTTVVQRTVFHEQWGDPGEGWNDGGAEPVWRYQAFFPQYPKTVIKPPKGLVSPGDGLYEERYHVIYQRTHYWWRTEEIEHDGNVTVVVMWNNMTDFLIEEVVLHTVLHSYAGYVDSSGTLSVSDVVDIFYVNETVDDRNLEDTLMRYQMLFPDVHPDKQLLIRTQGNLNIPGLERTISGDIPAWVFSESWNALCEILQDVGTIQQDPLLSSSSHMYPGDLMSSIRDDLLNQYTENMSTYQNLSAYTTGSLFQSVGRKVVYCVRDWYVSALYDEMVSVFSTITDQLTQHITQALPGSASFTVDDIQESLSDAVVSNLKNQVLVPFGFDMVLRSIERSEHPAVAWNETIRLAIGSVPPYLSAFEKTPYGDETFYALKINNTCVLGPTGVPLLPPTPVTPWIVTFNLWIIDIRGEYAEFTVTDSSDETIFHPVFGHEPQQYIRRSSPVFCQGVLVGENTRLCFKLTTVAFSIVPAWGMMVGDKEGGFVESHGWD